MARNARVDVRVHSGGKRAIEQRFETKTERADWYRKALQNQWLQDFPDMAPLIL